MLNSLSHLKLSFLLTCGLGFTDKCDFEEIITYCLDIILKTYPKSIIAD